MADYILPLILCITALAALHRKEQTYDILIAGAEDGMKILKGILPSLVLLLSAVSMLRASGALDYAAEWMRPFLRHLKIPPETILLILIRPISGSAALAVGAELICTYGPDSLIGRTAAVMLGSTETTFYVISVYFGACGIRSSRYAPAAALFADAVGFLAASASVRWFM